MRLFLALAAFSALSFAQTPAPWEAPFAQQKWSEAEPLLQQAIAAGDDLPALHALAALYRGTGRLADAGPILERLVSLEETPANVEELARTRAALGTLDVAETLYRRALELRTSLGSEPAAIIGVHQRLARVLAAEKKFPEAETEALAAMALRVRTAGAKSPDVASDDAVLARIYQGQKKWPEAAGIWDNAAQIQAAAFGDEDLRLAETLIDLAACQAEMQLTAQAEDSLHKALAIRELNLGSVHADVAEVTDALGTLLFKAKRYADAEPFYQRSLDIYKVLFGEDNPMLARSYDNLAVSKAMLEKFDEAEPLYKEALKLRDVENAGSLRNLALVYVARKKPADAEPLYARLVALLDSPGNQNPDLLKAVLGEYAGVLRDLNRPAEAVKLETRMKNGNKPAGPAPLPGKRTSIAAKQKQ